MVATYACSLPVRRRAWSRTSPAIDATDVAGEIRGPYRSASAAATRSSSCARSVAPSAGLSANALGILRRGSALDRGGPTLFTASLHEGVPESCGARGAPTVGLPCRFLGTIQNPREEVTRGVQ